MEVPKHGEMLLLAELAMQIVVQEGALISPGAC